MREAPLDYFARFQLFRNHQPRCLHPMLNQPNFQLGSNADEVDGSQRVFQHPLLRLDFLSIARRQIWVFSASIVIAGIIGFIYLFQVIPMYTSSVSILIDAKKVGMTASSPLEGSLTFETGAVESQLQILTSDKLASSVAQRLGLQNNMAFIDPPGSPLSRAIGGVSSVIQGAVRKVTGSDPGPSIKDLPENLRLLIATNVLQNAMKVQRVGRTYVFALDYTDRDPVLAQAIAGQFANAYLEDQLDSKFDSTRRATNWMEERIRDLKARSLAADEAVQKYRADNNLIAASGRLIDEQSLTDATTQLTAARSALDTASARYQRLKQIIDTQDVNGSLTESMSNPNVASLRSKYLEAAKLASEITARYGATHQAAVKARKDMEEYTRLIFEELTNLLPGYQSDVAIAQAQVASIQNTIEQLRQASTVNDTAMVKLRALEQESDTLKTLYSTFLQKSQELQQQQSFPVTDARVISDASVPLLPSGPKKAVGLAVALFVGALFGIAIALVREWRDRGFRTAFQIRDELGLEFIANVPVLRNTTKRPIADSPVNSETTRRLTSSDNGILQKVVDEPFSQFSESIRALRTKISLEFPGKKGVVIGLISMYPDEGKSTVAKNLASSLALQGAATLLVDGDLRNPSLTSNLVGSAKGGLAEVLAGQAGFHDVISIEQQSGLSFLPGSARRRQTNDVFGSAKAHYLMEQLRTQYDVVVLDFPPVGALTDAVAAGAMVDGYFFVVQWGKTQRSVVREFLVNHSQLADKVLGVVLNKVDLKRLGRYGAYQGSAAYSKYSDKYFTGDNFG